LRWAKICREEQLATKTKNLLFGIVQGGDQADLRKKSCLALQEIGFDGYAIGGVSVGEPEKEMMAAIDSSAPICQWIGPVMSWGWGTPTRWCE